jgi:hypothetical protein
VAKSLDEYFIDWEAETFGFGYGTGEPFTLAALKTFSLCLENDHSYNYEVLEEKLGGTAAWLLINTLCHADVIEYGTSPRYGWLDFYCGNELNAYLKTKTVHQLVDLVCSVECGHTHCYSHYCNCHDGKSCIELNPFWSRSYGVMEEMRKKYGQPPYPFETPAGAAIRWKD